MNQSFKYSNMPIDSKRFEATNKYEGNKFDSISFRMLEDLKKLLGVHNDNMLQREIEELLIFRQENSKKIEVITLT